MTFLKDKFFFFCSFQKMILADAQTSGGLLISMPMKDASSYVKKMNDQTSIIGHITKKKSYLIKDQISSIFY